MRPTAVQLLRAVGERVGARTTECLWKWGAGHKDLRRVEADLMPACASEGALAMLRTTRLRASRVVDRVAVTRSRGQSRGGNATTHAIA